MENIAWKVTRPLPDDTGIKTFEEKTGHKLPTDYFECVLINNAGYPNPERVKSAKGDERVLNGLLNYDQHKKANIFSTYETFVQSTGRKDIVPFANDPFGNYFCFDFAQSISVVFWKHETNTVEEICDSFTNLLELLY